MQESNQEPELHYRTQDTDELQPPGCSLKQAVIDWARVLGTGTINLSSSLKQAVIDWARVLGTGTINLANSPRSLIQPLGALAYAALMPVVVSFVVSLPSGVWSRNYFRDYYDVRCLLHLCLPLDRWSMVLAPEAWLITLVVGLLPGVGWRDALFLTCMLTFPIVWIGLDLVFSQLWGAWGRVILIVPAVVIRIIAWVVFLVLYATGPV
jgi:hypothetical protein